MGVPKYKFVHKALKRVFYKRENIIHLFTEDKKDDQIFYDLLFKRLENDTLKIGSITTLGSRANVMKKSLQDRDPSVPTLYIIDGDIDLVKDKPIESKNLLGLDRYCIENYLCCEEGIIRLLITNFGGVYEEYKSKLEFHSTLNKFGRDFLKIAIRYQIAQELQCATGFKKANDFFFIRNGGIFKPEKQKLKDEIDRVESLIKEKMRENGVRAFDREMKRMIGELESKNSFSIDNYLRVISGKDFLLPVLEKKLKMVESRLTGWHSDQLKRNLAERIDITSFKRVRLKMESML